MAAIVFTCCFFLQGLAYILVVQDNSLNDETTSVLVPSVFHLLDCAALLALLHLLARGVAARVHKVHRRQRSSSKEQDETHVKTFKSSTTEMNSIGSTVSFATGDGSPTSSSPVSKQTRSGGLSSITLETKGPAPPFSGLAPHWPAEAMKSGAGNSEFQYTNSPSVSGNFKKGISLASNV